MNYENLQLLSDYQEQAIIALRKELKSITAERDFFFDQLNDMTED